MDKHSYLYDDAYPVPTETNVGWDPTCVGIGLGAAGSLRTTPQLFPRQLTRYSMPVR